MRHLLIKRGESRPLEKSPKISSYFHFEDFWKHYKKKTLCPYQQPHQHPYDHHLPLRLLNSALSLSLSTFTYKLASCARHIIKYWHFLPQRLLHGTCPLLPRGVRGSRRWSGGVQSRRVDHVWCHRHPQVHHHLLRQVQPFNVNQWEHKTRSS